MLILHLITQGFYWQMFIGRCSHAGSHRHISNKKYSHLNHQHHLKD